MSEQSNSGREAQIRERVSKATAEHWELSHGDFGAFVIEKASITAGWRASSSADRCVSYEQAEFNGEFIAHARQDIPWLLTQLDSEREHRHDSCPCRHTTPCHPRCTCVMGGSSSGCKRCCAYGSEEQQANAAKRLASLATHNAAVEGPSLLAVELIQYLDSIDIHSDNIGDIRRACFVPWDSAWNGFVRDETAKRERTPHL